MIFVLVESVFVQPVSETLHLLDDGGQEEMPASVVDWDAVDDERCGLFP